MFDSNRAPPAMAGLKRIAQLYRIEHRSRGAPAAARQFVWWTESAPLVNAFGGGRIDEKLTDIANRWDRMPVFLYDGRVEYGLQLRRGSTPPDQAHGEKRVAKALPHGAASRRTSGPA